MITRAGLTTFLICGTNLIFAQDDQKLGLSPAEVKSIVRETIKELIAFINPLDVLERMDEFKDELKKLEREYESRMAQAKSLQEAGMKKQQELEKMGNALSDNAKDRKREELLQLETQCRIKVQGAQDYAQRAQQELQMRLLKKVQEEAELLE